MNYPILLAPHVQAPPPFEMTDSAPSTERSFILANTISSTLTEMNRNHIIPVFSRDNEPVISHCDFVETMYDAVNDTFYGESILEPVIRLSHPIKGRVPSARDKAAKDLLEHEKTIYYERSAFVIELPSVRENVSGNELTLTVGGVKAYNLDRLNNRKGVDEHFKIFIGFQNKVCTNMCVWTDGFVADLRVKNLAQLRQGIQQLFYDYDMHQQLNFLHGLDKYHLTESQFAQLIGRLRLYQYLPYRERIKIPAIQLSDTQINVVAHDYFKDESFCKDDTGSINLWRLYNLFTGANKSSYVDTFLDRGVSTSTFIHSIKEALHNSGECWFLR